MDLHVESQRLERLYAEGRDPNDAVGTAAIVALTIVLDTRLGQITEALERLTDAVLRGKP